MNVQRTSGTTTASLRMLGTFVAFASWLGATDLAVAQGPQNFRNFSRPTTSPYLSLLDNNSSFVNNYFRRVRPELEFRAHGAQLQQNIQGLRTDLTKQGLLPDGRQPLSSTGHSTTFLDTRGYFPSPPR